LASDLIRTGTIADLDQIVMVRTSVRENHLSVAQMAAIGITPAAIAAQMADGALACWVAEEEGRVVGFSMAERETATIFALFVLPQWEGRGLGSALLAACEDWLRGLGHLEARLETGADTRAYAFYARKGWVPTAERAGHFAEDVVMRKRL
jgi:GNAT superfamily N-acetyltransferase